MHGPEPSTTLADDRNRAAPGRGADGAAGVYRPRRAAATPLFRLLADHFDAFHAVYEERFAATYGDWRPVVREVAGKFLACGILAHGFARVRCEGAGGSSCGHEYLVAFSCKGRYFCPSCHAKRLALWSLWLEETLLAREVPHRQVVLTIPKRLRAWCLYRRRLLGDLSRAAARTVTAAVRTMTREPALRVGVIASVQTHRSRANWHPHIHMVVTDGGFRPDGTFVSWPAHDTAQLTEAFRRAVLLRDEAVRCARVAGARGGVAAPDGARPAGGHRRDLRRRDGGPRGAHGSRARFRSGALPEFDLLWALVEADGAAVSRDRLMERVCGYGADVLSRTVDTHVAELRRKLEPGADPSRHIVTVRKVGYRLVR